MLLLLFLPTILAQTYISEPPVKLLTANLFGSQYAASDTEYRVSTTGHDIEIHLSELEETNQMPKEELVLAPGGKAVFHLPIEKELIYLMIKPGKKQGGHGSPFSDKANITVTAALTKGSSEVSKDCNPKSHDSSASSSDYCILDLKTLVEEGEMLDWIVVTVSVPQEETRKAYIWQLHLSPLDNSERVKATFREEGRQLLRNIQQDEVYNTWLTMVSIVGNTGVGKSTLASLLSGNETMFKTANSNIGTTTIGADISTIIPGDSYRKRMEEVLCIGPLFQPAQSRPLFLIDSEGMSFRGKEVDFVTTGPVAIIANIIIWITTGRIQPRAILERVQQYMDGLDRITMGNDTSDEHNYGEFIIVLNKMQESDQDFTDEEICDELMAWGSSSQEDATREEMTLRFKEIVCIGLPTLDTFPITYPSLEAHPRFRKGLKKLSNRILKESETPLNVSVGKDKYEMNSTEAETIIGMLIDGANKGNIDLSDPCNVIFSLVKEKIIQGLAKVTADLEVATQGKCNNMTHRCTSCVCEYKNKVVEVTNGEMVGVINVYMEEADILCTNPIVKKSIEGLIDERVNPWGPQNQCEDILEEEVNNGNICDISQLQRAFEEAAGEHISVECDTLHICGETKVYNSDLTLNTSNIFISPGATLEQEAPSKAENGKDGNMGQSGIHGMPGKIGKGIKLAISGSFLRGSEQQLRVTLRGGEGGDGGRGGQGIPAIEGRPGKSGKNGSHGNPGTKGKDGEVFYPGNEGDVYSCEEVIRKGGPQGGVVRWKHGESCCCGERHEDYYYQLYEWTYTANSDSKCTYKIDGQDGTDGRDGSDGANGSDGEDAVPAGKGGDGGRGGDGGIAGRWELIPMDANLSVSLHQIGGRGGAGGLPGTGGDGAFGGKGGDGGLGGKGGLGGVGGKPGSCKSQMRTWSAHHNWHVHCGSWQFICKCKHHNQVDPCTNFQKGTFSEYRPYKTGAVGNPGKNGKNGASGKSGKSGFNAGASGPGRAGDPGQDAVSTSVEC